MGIFKAARDEIAFDRAVQRKESRGTFAGPLPCPGLRKKVDFAGKAGQRAKDDFTCVIFHDDLGDEQRIVEIGKRVVESLPRVDRTKRFEIGLRVLANDHLRLC